MYNISRKIHYLKLRIMQKISMMITVAALLAACNNAPKEANKDAKAAADAAAAVAAAHVAASTGAGAAASAAAGAVAHAVAMVGKPYAVSAGSIGWIGTKPTGKHAGTINVKSGAFAMDKGNITGGEFDIDLTSLVCTDLKEDQGKAKLEGHLKSGDFFEVEKFPAGKFSITKVEPLTGNANATHTVSGDLTLKGVTKAVSFPALVKIEGNKVTATSSAFNINRTDWGINFNSGILGTAKDKLINDAVAITINLHGAAK
jgi:polyisoprenoid-binding protein YceI